MFAALVLAGCGSDEADIGEKKETIAKQKSAAEELSKANLAKSFQEGIFKADVMAIGLPADLHEKMEKITQAMQASLAKNEEWYSETVSKLAEGDILPYDEKLGITEEDYKLLLEADQHFELGKIAESEVTITKADGQTILQNHTAEIVKELKISTDGSTLHSDLGELSYIEAINASEAQAITGRWNGHFLSIRRSR